jgi:hypothetical protein
MDHKTDVIEEEEQIDKLSNENLDEEEIDY